MQTTPQADTALPTAEEQLKERFEGAEHRRRRERTARDLEAAFARRRRLQPVEVESVELLLRDAQRMAAVHLARAQTVQAQEKLSDEIWNHLVQLYGLTAIRYSEFNAAVWHEGYRRPGDLSLAEMAEGLPSTLKAERSKSGRPKGLPVDREELIKLRAGRTKSHFAQLIGISADKLARAEKDGNASEDTLRAINRYSQKNAAKKGLQKPQ
jgi:hypothetical protein